MLKKLWTKVVVWRYTELGMRYGDALSYSYMGKCIGFDRLERRFELWEKRYENLGFKPIDIDDFITAGGYTGPGHLKDRLYLPKL